MSSMRMAMRFPLSSTLQPPLLIVLQNVYLLSVECQDIVNEKMCQHIVNKVL
jgi:hypothetical protein